MIEFELTSLLCFCESYFTILSYWSKPDISARIIDLFLLEGESIIHDIIVSLLFLCKKEILACNN